MEQLSKQLPTTLEIAKAQVELIKSKSKSKLKKQRILKDS